MPEQMTAENPLGGEPPTAPAGNSLSDELAVSFNIFKKEFARKKRLWIGIAIGAALFFGLGALVGRNLFYLLVFSGPAVLLSMPFSAFKNGFASKKRLWRGISIGAALCIGVTVLVNPNFIAYLVYLMIGTPLMAFTLVTTFKIFDPSLRAIDLKKLFLLALGVAGVGNTGFGLVKAAGYLGMSEGLTQWFDLSVWAGSFILIMKVFELDIKEIIIIAIIYTLVFNSFFLLISARTFDMEESLRNLFG